MNAKEYLSKQKWTDIDNTYTIDEIMSMMMEDYHQHKLSEITEEEMADKLAAFYLTAKRPLHRVAAKAITNLLKGER